MSDWTREYKSLKQKVIALEKDTFKLLSFTRTTTLKNEIQSLAEFEEKKDFERHKEIEELNVFISSLRKDLVNLKHSLKNYSRDPTSLGKIQEITEKIEDKLAKFKEKQMVNFDKLLEEENTLMHEIDLIAERMETYETALEAGDLVVGSKARGARATSVRAKNTSYQPSGAYDDEEEEKGYDYDADDFESEGIKHVSKAQPKQDLAKKFKEQIDKITFEMDKLGGAAMGWDAEDHQTFLKVRTKHKNNVDKIAFLNDCITSLPFLGEEQIEEHIEKFKRYLTLEEEKKKLTREYRENKENEKKNIIESIRQEDLRREEAKKNSTLLAKTKEERDKNKEKLKEWKAHKMARQAVEHEKVKELEVIKKKEREVVDKVKKEAVQKRVQEFKEKKELEKIREKEKEEYKKALQKRRLDKEEQERLKEREDNLIKRNIEKTLLAKKKEHDKAERMQKLIEANSTAYTYVDSRLNEETKAIAEKKREKFDPSRDTGRLAGTFGGDLTRKAGRAIPMWRQGLS